MIARIVRGLSSFVAGPESDKGVATIEFAFLAPAFVLTIYGIIEFFRATFTMAVLYFAAEEATRYATVRYDATVDSIKSVANERLLLIDPSRITRFDVTSVLDTSDQTKHVTVEIEYSFTPMLPVPWEPFSLSGHSRGFIVEK